MDIASGKSRLEIETLQQESAAATPAVIRSASFCRGT
jgi:hypothetical protein